MDIAPLAVSVANRNVCLVATMGKPQPKSQKPDARGGRFLLLPYCLVSSEAFRTASPRAIKALIVLWQHHNGFNNGKISVGFRELAEGMDSQFHAGNIAAVGELIARGIIALSTDHPKAQRLAREYRLTFIPSASGPATHEYLKWRDGDAGSRRKPVVGAGTNRKNGLAVTATETAQTAADTATELEETAADTETGKIDNDANPPFSIEPSAAIIATHIGNHLGPLVGVPKNLPEIGKGPFSAAPDADELRARIVGLMGRLGRGTQFRLAKQAAVSAASMSRFLNGASNLGERARVRLSLAIPRVELDCTGAPLQRPQSSKAA